MAQGCAGGYEKSLLWDAYLSHGMRGMETGSVAVLLSGSFSM